MTALKNAFSLKLIKAIKTMIAAIAIEAYDPATNIWTNKASMQKARSSPGNVGVVNGVIYAVGGDGTLNTVEAYNPATNTWAYVVSI